MSEPINNPYLDPTLMDAYINYSPYENSKYLKEHGASKTTQEIAATSTTTIDSNQQQPAVINPLQYATMNANNANSQLDEVMIDEDIIGLPFATEDEDQAPMTFEQLKKLRCGDKIWMYDDEIEEAWMPIIFKNLDGNGCGFMYQDTKGEEVFVEVYDNDTMPALYLQPPSNPPNNTKEKEITTTTTTSNKYNKYNDYIIPDFEYKKGAEIFVYDDANNYIFYKIEEYDNKTTKATVIDNCGIKHELTLKQFKHESADKASKRLEIVKSDDYDIKLFEENENKNNMDNNNNNQSRLGKYIACSSIPGHWQWIQRTNSMKLKWISYKNTLLGAIAGATKHLYPISLDYKTLMFISGCGLGFNWLDVDHEGDDDDDEEDDDDDDDFDDDINDDYSNNDNSNNDNDNDDNNNNDEKEQKQKPSSSSSLKSLKSKKKSIETQEDVIEDHMKLFLMDSQLDITLNQISKYSNYKFDRYTISEILHDEQNRLERLKELEDIIVSKLKSNICSITNDENGHLALIVGFIKKPPMYSPERTNIPTSYYFKLKKFGKYDSFNKEENEKYEYIAIDLFNQLFVITMIPPIKDKKNSLQHTFNPKMLLEIITDLIKTYETQLNMKQDIDLFGRKALQQLSEEMRKAKQIENVSLKLGKLTIFSLIRLFDSRKTSIEFFNDNIIQRITNAYHSQTGAEKEWKLSKEYDISQDAKLIVNALKEETASIRRQQQIFEEYILSYNGKPFYQIQWKAYQRAGIKAAIDEIIMQEDIIIDLLKKMKEKLTMLHQQ